MMHNVLKIATFCGGRHARVCVQLMELHKIALCPINTQSYSYIIIMYSMIIIWPGHHDLN